ncbi:hypothetical protein [Teichococcus oryzae]|uniref:Uncharacterized protein n=1 Tax=Teichococcus oryzae TaxID=1608942 RepID=A0A5B2TBI7_9PROT|nr:hypothetical protein [Pseudoroseomonas oryzae]KAA2211425.1 hypothetical protein F0Q34_20205 [Pseudoroseomonas oryzae]
MSSDTVPAAPLADQAKLSRREPVAVKSIKRANGRINDVPPASADLQRLGGSTNDTFNNDLLRSVIATAWFGKGEDRAKAELRKSGAVAAAMAGFHPKDEVEGMLVGQAVALHQAAMECMRRAMLPEQPFEVATKLRKDAANLSRAVADMIDALDRKRGKGPQVVRVERVVVQEGAQAIVGTVTSTSREGGGA